MLWEHEPQANNYRLVCPSRTINMKKNKKQKRTRPIYPDILDPLLIDTPRITCLSNSTYATYFKQRPPLLSNSFVFDRHYKVNQLWFSLFSLQSHQQVCSVSRSFCDTLSIYLLSNRIQLSFFPFFLTVYSQLVLSSLFQGKSMSFQVTQILFCLVLCVLVASLSLRIDHKPVPTSTLLVRYNTSFLIECVLILWRFASVQGCSRRLPACSIDTDACSFWAVQHDLSLMMTIIQ